MIELGKVSFADLLAPSIADDPTIKAMAAALDDEFREVTEAIDTIILLPELDRITDPALVDQLAWQMHVDFYDPSLPLATRKLLIRESIPWHVRKGTVAMLQEVLNTFFEPGAATIQEWFQYKTPLPPQYPLDGWHDRYRFRILIDQDVIDSDAQAAAERLINAYKPVSRWPEATVRARATNCDIFVGIGSLGWKYVTIEAPSLARGPLFVSRLDPNRAPVNTQIELQVYGTNFAAASQIIFDGSPQETVFYDQAHLSASVQLGPVPGTHDVFVSEPGLADSNRLNFESYELARMLVLDRVEPNPVNQGQIIFDYYGSGFSEDTEGWYRGTVRPTTFVDQGHLRVGQMPTGNPVEGGANCHVREAGMANSNAVFVTIIGSEAEHLPNI